MSAYWVAVDGDTVGTIAPFQERTFKEGLFIPVSMLPDYWSWTIKFPLLEMPDWCKGRAPTFEQARIEAQKAFTRIRESMSQAEYDQAMWKKDGKVRGLN
jgi:hypothetical protein